MALCGPHFDRGHRRLAHLAVMELGSSLATEASTTSRAALPAAPYLTSPGLAMPKLGSQLERTW